VPEVGRVGLALLTSPHLRFPTSRPRAGSSFMPDTRIGHSASHCALRDETDAAAIAPTITGELHAMLVKRADDIEGCPAGSDEEHELAAIERAIGVYEAVLWPTGKVAGGKG